MPFDPTVSATDRSSFRAADPNSAVPTGAGPTASVPAADARPRVSVVIGAHLRVQYLKRAVTSAVRQGPDETVVVKFASDPELDAELTRLGARVFVTREPLPGGKFADGIEQTNGDVISFMDDDDVFLSGKIDRVREVFSDSRVVFHANRYTAFTDVVPEVGRPGPLRLFDTALGDQYWSGLQPVISACASVRREMIRPWIGDLRRLGVSDHTMFMMAVKARRCIAMDQSVLTGWHLNQIRGVLRPASSIWYQPGASARFDYSWMLDLLDSESGGVRATLTPMVAKAIVHLVFLTGERQFHEYRRTMRALLDGVGVRRPLAIGTILLVGYPVSPRLALALGRTWKSLVGFQHNPG